MRVCEGDRVVLEHRSLLVLAFLLVAPAGCGSRSADDVSDGRAVERQQTDTEPAEFSLDDTAALLAERRIFLEPLPGDKREGLLTERAFGKLLDARMEEHPHWRELSVHLASVDMPDGHFEIFDQPTYVVEVTGPETGNCFDFYLATNGDYQLGACFYPTRS